MAPAWLCRPGHFFEGPDMTDDDEHREFDPSQARLYLASAIECLNIASRTHDITMRIRLIAMAQSWIALAAQSERAARGLPSRQDDNDDCRGDGCPDTER